MLNIFFSLNLTVYEVKWKKYCKAGQGTDDNKGHAVCMLDI